MRRSHYSRQVSSILPGSGSPVFDRIIRDNEDVFAKKGRSPGRCVCTPMQIETTGPPLSQAGYRAPLTKR